jgi:hypothetical protein
MLSVHKLAPLSLRRIIEDIQSKLSYCGEGHLSDVCSRRKIKS